MADLILGQNNNELESSSNHDLSHHDHHTKDSLVSHDGQHDHFVAVLDNDPHQLEFLFTNYKAHIDIDVRDNGGYTALMRASTLSQSACVKILCNHGANVMITNKDGMNALMMAALNGSHDSVYSILASGELLMKVQKLDIRLDVTAKNVYGVTALMLAVLSESFNIVNMLVLNQADIDAQNDYGITALMLAASNGNLKILEFLLSLGANVHLKEKKGMTALMVKLSTYFFLLYLIITHARISHLSFSLFLTLHSHTDCSK